MTSTPIGDGLFDVPVGKLPCVVTHLEMRSQPPEAGLAVPEGLSLRQVHDPQVAWYRRLYRSIGAPWLWWSRLELDDAALGRLIGDRGIEIRIVEGNGEHGLAELDFRVPGACELVYFGLVPGMTGRGIGRWLLQEVTAAAWARPIDRFWVHTCTLDDPRALPFYMKAGFRPYKRQVEIADDPRAIGLWAENAAPDIPRL